jgi:hypothetical protein
MSPDQEQRDREQRRGLWPIADEIQAERWRSDSRRNRCQRSYPEQQCEGEPHAEQRDSQRYRKREGDTCRRRDSLAPRKAMEYGVDVAEEDRERGTGRGQRRVAPARTQPMREPYRQEAFDAVSLFPVRSTLVAPGFPDP